MTSLKDQEELETWLEEVEQASKEIKKMTSGELSVEELDKQLARKEAKKRRAEQAEVEKRQQELEKKKLGRFGKGHKGAYANFCKFCFREYEFPTPECLHCKNKTETQEERKEFLMGKVKELQSKQTKKKERKVKWDLWKKTQSMLWKKTSTNYSKWDYFTSSSEEEPDNSEPIVPENDPQFKAMEADIEKRAKDRKEKRKKAEEYKLKGNEYLKKEDYEKAVLWYSEGLDLIKDYKPLWTNRALAWLKMKYYNKCIKDCTRVLEYCECFEDGYVQSKDFTFKAFIRRAQARKEKKDYRLAMEDVEQSLKLFPQEKSAIDLKKEIDALIKHKEQADKLLSDKQKLEKKEKVLKKEQDNKQETQPKKEEQEEQKTEKQEPENTEENPENKPEKPQEKEEKEEQEAQQEEEEEEEEEEQNAIETEFNEAESIQKSYMALIDQFMKKDNEKIQEIEIQILKYTFTNLEESKIYFFEKKGLNKLLKVLQLEKPSKQVVQAHSSIYQLLDLFIRDNIVYQTQLTSEKGIQFLLGNIEKLLIEKTNVSKDMKEEYYDQIEQMLEILTTLSMTDKIRDQMKDLTSVLNFVFKTHSPILKLFKTEVPMVSNWLKFVGNMCYQTSKTKKEIIKNFIPFLNQLYPIFSYDKMRSKFELLRDNAFTLFANLLTEPQARDILAQGQLNDLLESIILRISTYDLQKQPKYLNAASASLSVMVNASFKSTPQTKAILNELKAGEIMLNRFQKLDHKQPEYKDLFFRLLQALASLNYANQSLLEKEFHTFALKFFDDYSIISGFTNHAIRILANIFIEKQNEIWLSKNIQDSYYDLLTFQLKKMIKSDDELRFSNSCILSGTISLLKPKVVNPKYKDVILRLLDVCGNKVGNMRQTAAQLVGKLARDPDNLDIVRQNHGIEILHSILKDVV